MSGRLRGKTLFVSGGSRGIGLAIALRAARDGANVVIAAETSMPHERLPGTVHSAAEQIEAPIKRFDLMHQVCARATDLVTQHALPHRLRAENPHVLAISPPLHMEERWFAPHVAYTMAKFGMSLVVLGVAGGFRGRVGVHALWPRTSIDTAAMAEFGSHLSIGALRSPDIMADAAYLVMTADGRIGRPRGLSTPGPGRDHHARAAVHGSRAGPTCRGPRPFCLGHRPPLTDLRGFDSRRGRFAGAVVRQGIDFVDVAGRRSRGNVCSEDLAAGQRARSADDALPACFCAQRLASRMAMRRRQLQWLWARLARLREMTLSRDALLMKLGSALGRQLQSPAPGLTARGALEKFAAVQMVDVHLPTTDGRELMLTRYTLPEPELTLLLERLPLALPAQPPPRITATQAATARTVRCRLSRIAS